MSSAIGRSVVGYKVNKSGGGVIKGDVVVPDTTNDNAFTTTTSAAATSGVWVADETIANNATGRVVLEGHVTLVNVSASVTRGHTGTTHTVAKQAVSTGGTTRTAGTFCKFTTGGTTPEADIWPVDLLGTSLTNPMSAVGDIIQGTTAGAPAALAAPLAGKVLTGAGVTTPLVYAYPPGYQWDYGQATSDVNVTATVEASANTIVTGNSVTYDGAAVDVFFSVADCDPPNTAGNWMQFILFDGTSAIGVMGFVMAPATSSSRRPASGYRRITPSAGAHTYSVRGIVNAGTGVCYMGAAGAGTRVPGTIRITKA